MGEKQNGKKCGRGRELRCSKKERERKERKEGKKRKEENRNKENRKERKKKGKEKGNRNQRRAGSIIEQNRTRNCATRGRFPLTLVILHLGVT